MKSLQELLEEYRPKFDGPKEAFARAMLGAADLEKDKPGSVASLDARSLDIGNAEKCPLGQVYDDYWKAPAYLIAKANQNGYAIRYDDTETNVSLTLAWMLVIQAYKDASA